MSFLHLAYHSTMFIFPWLYTDLWKKQISNTYKTWSAVLWQCMLSMYWKAVVTGEIDTSYTVMCRGTLINLDILAPIIDLKCVYITWELPACCPGINRLLYTLYKWCSFVSSLCSTMCTCMPCDKIHFCWYSINTIIINSSTLKTVLKRQPLFITRGLQIWSVTFPQIRP